METLLVSPSSSSLSSSSASIPSFSPVQRSHNLHKNPIFLKPQNLSFTKLNRRTTPCAAQNMSSSAASASTDGPLKKEIKLWGGRFEESVTDAVENFTESISFDKVLYKHDIMGSRAHASMLAHQVFFWLIFFLSLHSVKWIHLQTKSHFDSSNSC